MNHKASESLPVQRLRHHVTGAIERGETQAIAGIPAIAPQTAQSAEASRAELVATVDSQLQDLTAEIVRIRNTLAKLTK